MLVVLLAHDDLAVGGNVEEEAVAVGHEELLVGRFVVPAHAPGSLQPHLSALDDLPSQRTRAVGLGEAGADVGHPLLTMLQLLDDSPGIALRRRSRCRGLEQKKREQSKHHRSRFMIA